MKEGLIEKIKSRGYWRFNFEPLKWMVKLETSKDCQNIVEKNAVRLGH